MPSPIITEQLTRIDLLVNDIDRFAPSSETKATRFRAELGGILTVYIVASYENCVKETLISFASMHSVKFEEFIERQFEKLNSKIQTADLRNYGKRLDTGLAEVFHAKLERRRKLISKICGRNIESQLRQMLEWRHEYAHAGKLVTTVEEALTTHRLARIPIQTFEEVFSSHPSSALK